MFELPSPDGPLTKDDLRAWTNKMIDYQRELIAGCTDADVVFQPIDPKADDPYASDAEEVNMPWTLGHLIVHITASSEESAALAAELARGVAFHGRSRSEVPWQTVTTIQQCFDRLEESRRMRLASLEIWPDDPDVENSYKPYESAPMMNCYRRFMGGLRHDNSHLDQIEDVVGQAQAARVTL